MPNNLAELEMKLWDAADELRANSKLSAAEYSTPVLGLIFLRFADHKFTVAEKELSKTGTGRRTIGKTDYQARGVLYLPPEARFSRLIALPEGENIGKALNDAMKVIEADNEDLRGILPKTYTQFENKMLVELLKLMNSIPMDIEGDAFGKIYEYFLGEFALTEGRDGGEFFTPTPIVKLIVEVIEPFHGKIYDPACGSGGMFVQSARFVENHKKRASDEISVYGQEKTAETVRLCKMNLAVHGLSGDIREAISYYDDLHNSPGQFDFVMANPPFNVDRVDKERIKDDKRRFPFGMPSIDNANFLWIQLFLSSLNKTGRAGFVMTNTAADARSSEMEIRKKIITSNVVNAIVSVGPNMFYTVILPCDLWFFDKAKSKTKQSGTILFLDARDIYHQIDRSHRDWTDDQIGFLGNIVRLYRGESLDFKQGGRDTELKILELFGKKPKYTDIPGLCKVVTLKDVETQNWSLSPGSYVGVDSGMKFNQDRFGQSFEVLTQQFVQLTSEAHLLESTIVRNVKTILKTLE
jgi:type I restriction enzyme M protein